MYLVFTPYRMYLWWSLCTLYLHLTGCTSGGVYVPCIYTLQDVPLVEFMYLVFTPYRMYLWWSLCTLYLHLTGCTSGGVYVPCIYTLQDVPLVEFMYLVFTPYRMYLWWSLCTLYLLACQVWVTVVDSGLCCCVCVSRTPINSLVCRKLEVSSLK